MNYDRETEHEHLHSLQLMNELDIAQHSNLVEDVRAHLQKALNHLEAIYEHLEESVEFIETSGARRDVDKAKEHIAQAIDLARAAVNMPEEKMRVALQECRDHVEIANRQISRAGIDAAI